MLPNFGIFSLRMRDINRQQGLPQNTADTKKQNFEHTWCCCFPLSNDWNTQNPVLLLLLLLPLSCDARAAYLILISTATTTVAYRRTQKDCLGQSLFIYSESVKIGGVYLSSPKKWRKSAKILMTRFRDKCEIIMKVFFWNGVIQVLGRYSIKQPQQ